MATAMSNPTFNLQPPLDDTMEISSDQGHFDGDIDIDLGSEQGHFADDDQMLEDAKSDNGTHNDDVMLDEGVQEGMGDGEDGIMQDDAAAPTEDQDEDLIDYSDNDGDGDSSMNQEHGTQSNFAAARITVTEDEAHNAEEESSLPSEPQLPPQPSVPHEELADSTAEEVTVTSAADGPLNHNDGITLQQPPSDIQVPESYEPDLPEVAEADVEEASEQPASAAQDTDKEEPDSTAQEAEGANVTEQVVQPRRSFEAAVTEDDSDKSQPAGLSIDTQAIAEQDASTSARRESHPSTPTVTGLHPTIVIYGDMHISLFPSGDPTSQDQFFLENENLVNSSIGDLLGACRIVLAETISEDEELVLGVEELDLQINEDSTPAFSASFSEILDVFVQLHRHDGTEQPPPLYVTLEARTRFTSRLSLLTQMASEGKGFSQLPLSQSYHEEQDVAGYDHDGNFAEDGDVEAPQEQYYEARYNGDYEQHDENNVNGDDSEQAPDHEYVDSQVASETFNTDAHDDVEHQEFTDDQDQTGEYDKTDEEQYTEEGTAGDAASLAEELVGVQPTEPLDQVEEIGASVESEGPAGLSADIPEALGDGDAPGAENDQPKFTEVSQHDTDDVPEDIDGIEDGVGGFIGVAAPDFTDDAHQEDEVYQDSDYAEGNAYDYQEGTYPEQDGLYESENVDQVDDAYEEQAIPQGDVAQLESGNANEQSEVIPAAGQGVPDTEGNEEQDEQAEEQSQHSGGHVGLPHEETLDELIEKSEHEDEDVASEGPHNLPDAAVGVARTPQTPKSPTTPGTKVGADGFDEIDFDDDDDPVEEPKDIISAQPTQAKASPSAKRSWAQQANEGEVDSEQESKKVKADP